MIKCITRDALKGTIDRNEDFILVDVLSRESFEKEHIPGSINIPLEDIFLDKISSRLYISTLNN